MEELVRSSTVWTPGEPPRPANLEETAAPSAIRWIDLAGEPAATDRLLARLTATCPGLTATMLSDLLTPDEQPAGSSYDAGRIRLTSTFSVEPRRLEKKTERGKAQRSGVLTFRPVELLAGDDWLVSCWHPAVTFAGAEKVAEGEAGGPGNVLDAVSRSWAQPNCTCAGDLGVLIMGELALSYRAAVWELAAWHEDWELSLYLADELDNEAELPNLWGEMAVLRDWLKTLNKPGLRADLNNAWLPVTNHQNVITVDDRVDKALDDLSSLANTMRFSFSILNAQKTEQDRESRESNMRRVELIAAIFLVPTLVVGFYGANTWVPGEGRHWGFWVMLLALILLSAATVAIVLGLRRAQRKESARKAKERARLQADLLASLDGSPRQHTEHGGVDRAGLVEQARG